MKRPRGPTMQAARALRNPGPHPPAMAATLRLGGATPYGLGPSAAYARRLSGVLSALGKDTSGPLGELAHASTQTAQASVEQRIAAAYARAATSLDATASPPAAGEAQAKIVAALRNLDGAYERAAHAAGSNDSGAYARARSDVKAASASLHRPSWDDS